MDTLFATTTFSAPVLVLSQADVYDIVKCLVVVTLLIVILPLLLSLLVRTRGKQAPDVKLPSPTFFKVLYITWFLVHYGISALAVIAILILGLDGAIKGTISALLGSLFGYVLGSTAAKGSASPQQYPDSTSAAKYKESLLFDTLEELEKLIRNSQFCTPLLTLEVGSQWHR